MSRTFFISDTHFGHQNIIRLAKRPFASVEEMDQAMIANWNAVVQPEDLVWHLGDVSWHHILKTAELLPSLNGRKRLVRGNHDPFALSFDRAFEWIGDYAEIKIEDRRVVLSHYPMEEWNGFYKGWIHLHGHVHGKTLNPIKNRYDVGVECIGYTPRLLSEIL